MPKVSRETAQVDDYGPVEDRHADVEGYTISFLTFRQDIDGTPLLKGLQDDLCQCPHWGYVFKGKLTFTVAGGEEVFEAGDAFYVPAGHAPILAEGTEYLQFSPAEELAVTSEVMLRNFQAMQHA
jgi:hypothetical protein